MSRSLFIRNIAPAAMELQKKHKILPSLIIAQACLESGFGRSRLATEGKNLFGVKGTYNGSFVLMKTKEWNKQKGWHTVEAKFRKYPSWQESIEDHSLLFVNGLSSESHNRYAALIGEASYKAATLAVKNAGYATDPNYPTLLNDIIEQYGLSRYDQKTFSNLPLNNPETITVKRGDTLSAIASKYGYTVEQLAKDNQLSDPNILYPGQVLHITSPSSDNYYQVKSGDTLSQIASRTGTSITTLVSLNKLTDPDKIFPEQRLRLK